MFEQRKSPRFELSLPVQVVRTSAGSVHTSGQTRNLSSSGVLIATDTPVPVGEPIEYLITLPVANGPGTVRLRCMGKVVRYEAATAAATLERYEFIRG